MHTTDRVQEPSLMTCLRDATAAQHQRAESSALERALAAGSLPRAGYVAVLAQRLCIHRMLERELRRLAEVDPRVAEIVRDEQYQEANLVEDLRHFGVSADDVAPLRATEALTAEIGRTAGAEPAGLLGYLYVLEGSKNGARHIARRIRPAYGLSGTGGTRYFDPHGEEQRPLWAAFKSRMDAARMTDREQEAMVAAARRAFDAVAAIGDEILRAMEGGRGQ